MSPTYNDPALAQAIVDADLASKAHAATLANLQSRGAVLAVQASKYLKILDTPPPVIEPPPPVIVVPGDPVTAPPSDVLWKTDAAALVGIKGAASYMQFGGDSWWPGKTSPYEMPAMSGVWRGYNTGAPDPATGQGGTLWFARVYNAFGLIEDLEVWDCGDFVQGREGHVIYGNFVPHKDTTIRGLRVRRSGGQAVQREFRLSETSIPESVWKSAVGTFVVEDSDFQETGLLDEVHGGAAVRASWAMSLYATGQRTIVRRVKHVNFHSPEPHEGSVFIGPGQSGFRTPFALVEDCDFWTESHDRAEVFFGACDLAQLRTTHLRGAANYVCVADDSKKFVLSEMPQDVEVRVQREYHAPPAKTYLVKKGSTLELSFP